MNLERLKTKTMLFFGRTVLTGMFGILLPFIDCPRVNGLNSSVTQCVEPSSIENGWLVNNKDSYNPGDTIKYSCNDVFRMVGSRRIKCKSDGTWSSNPPYCIEIRCPQLLPPLNGTIDPNNSTSTIGTVVNISCDDGFHLVGAGELICTINGTWMPKRMSYCQKNQTSRGGWGTEPIVVVTIVCSILSRVIGFFCLK